MADHLIFGQLAPGIQGKHVCLMLRDVSRKVSMAHPSRQKSAAESEAAMRDFVDLDVVREVYADNSPELICAIKALGLQLKSSTPYRPQSNGQMERSDQDYLNQGRTTLLAAGLGPQFWPFALKHACAVDLFVQSLTDGNTSKYEAITKEVFTGHIIPLGALVTVVPPPAEKAHKVAPGGEEHQFLGYVFHPSFVGRRIT